MPERLPLRRRLLFGAITVAIAISVAAAGLLAADLYLHHKYERISVVNIWGYRGPTIPAKAPGEFRAVVLGGSAAFGYGVAWDEAFPYFLERGLNATAKTARFRVVNLAYNNETAASFLPTLEDYRYLNYDLAILYEGYNDLIPRSRVDVFRRQSTTFRYTGYLPILPMVVKEKFYDWRYDGDISRAYGPASAGRTVFNAVADAGTAAQLERQLGSLGGESSAAVARCPERWSDYCLSVTTAVSFARRHNVKVIVATQPFISDSHMEQQAALDRALDTAFGGDTTVTRLNLGRLIDLKNKALAFDGMHLTNGGNRIVANAFIAPVLAAAGHQGGLQ